MSDLIKFNFKKIFNSSPFYIILGLFVLVVCTNLWSFVSNINNGAYNPDSASVFDFLLTVNNVSILLLYGLFTGWYTIDDYTNNTIKLMYGKGYSRFKVYISRFIVLTVIMTIYFLITVVFSLLLGVIFINNYTTKENVTSIIMLEYLGIFFYTFSIFCLSDIIKNVYAVSVFSASLWLIDIMYIISNTFHKLENKFLPSTLLSAYPLYIFCDSASSTAQIGEAILSGIIHITIYFLISFLINKYSERF